MSNKTLRQEKYSYLRNKTFDGKPIFNSKEATQLKDRSWENIDKLVEARMKHKKEWKDLLNSYTRNES